MTKNFLCLGLDSEAEKLPKGQTQLSFNQAIVEATHDLAAAYKLNSAFYEAQGSKGWEALKKTIAFIHQQSPGMPVIWDAKRGDIGNTSQQYARAAFEELQADAITLNPYLGRDALQPFLDYQDKTCYILCRTSNPGAKEFQDELYLKVAKKVVQEWNQNNNCGLVVGATGMQELQKVREIAPNLPLLIPGVGTQGGLLTEVLRYGKDSSGGGLLINVSRSVIFASSGKNFAGAARQKVLELIQK
ncbi:MAG: orotidine-5'-phosphate decarboxylase [Deltaproteobacteria bacterium]|nr:orotidine-5'-phosphate decarboxylase [Deltaproteobacteria bacterium]